MALAHIIFANEAGLTFAKMAENGKGGMKLVIIGAKSSYMFMPGLLCGLQYVVCATKITFPGRLLGMSSMSLMLCLARYLFIPLPHSAGPALFSSSACLLPCYWERRVCPSYRWRRRPPDG
jgi:hypothetical protein